ncbi:hypothetical protein [Geomicrobium sp. JCM 19039]|nr:hypothetical protein [Geomicrobium sp. JCM 19039]
MTALALYNDYDWHIFLHVGILDERIPCISFYSPSIVLQFELLSMQE